MIRKLRYALPAIAIAANLAAAETPGIPPHGKPIILFNGKDLSNFDIFMREHGLNNDSLQVFTVENGVVHVSGKEFGYFITKQEYENYYLTAEFKWGTGTYGNREGKARDSGILYHIIGPNHVWPTSIEFQIQEGSTGDFWMTDRAAITGKDGKRVTGPPGHAAPIDRFNKGAWKDVIDYRDPNGELEKPVGEWNFIELVVEGERARHWVNGKLANEGTGAYPAKGKILFQSEGAEIYFRNLKLYPLKMKKK
ncbi:MAG TPA: DUF1080 domain-containing protein [Bryobacteraceae bacterium]|nr:DUF1080 domain-containing protein [Bryobacteraceae bacterium]